MEEQEQQWPESKDEIFRKLQKGLDKASSNTHGRREVFAAATLEILIDIRDVLVMIFSVWTAPSHEGGVDGTTTGEKE